MSVDKSSSGDYRPDQAKPEHRPFPGAADNRAPVPPPAGVRTFDEIRADRSKYRSTSEYTAARNAEKAPAQDRGGGDQPERTTTRTRESHVATDEAGATHTAKRGPGGKHPDAAARPDATAQSDHDGPKTQVSEGPHSRGSAGLTHTPDSAPAQRGGKGGILHGHSEFHGRDLDLYTDGTRWIGGDAVRAVQAEAARARADGQPAPRRYGITDFPQMRDVGRNVVGEKEDRSPGDTSDLPPTGEELVRTADKDKPRLERLKNEAFQEFDGVVDGVKEEADAIVNAMSRPQPPGHPGVTVRDGPMIGPQEGHHIAPSPDSLTQAIIAGGVVGYRAFRWADHKITELRRRHDGGH